MNSNTPIEPTQNQQNTNPNFDKRDNRRTDQELPCSLDQAGRVIDKGDTRDVSGASRTPFPNGEYHCWVLGLHIDSSSDTL